MNQRYVRYGQMMESWRVDRDRGLAVARAAAVRREMVESFILSSECLIQMFNQEC